MLHVFQTHRWNDKDLLNIARVVHQLDLHRRHLHAQVSQEDDPAGTKEEKAVHNFRSFFIRIKIQ